MVKQRLYHPKLLILFFSGNPRLDQNQPQNCRSVRLRTIFRFCPPPPNITRFSGSPKPSPRGGNVVYAPQECPGSPGGPWLFRRKQKRGIDGKRHSHFLVGFFDVFELNLWVLFRSFIASRLFTPLGRACRRCALKCHDSSCLEAIHAVTG